MSFETDIQSLDSEIWKDIKNYEGKYKISSYGRVASYNKYSDRWKLRKLAEHSNNSGYSIRLCKNGEYELFLVGRLVAEHFIDNPDNYKYAIHKDGDIHNNHISNICWGNKNSKKFQNRDKRNDSVKVRAIFKNGKTIDFDSITACSKYTNTSHSYIAHKLRINDDKYLKGQFKVKQI